MSRSFQNRTRLQSEQRLCQSIPEGTIFANAASIPVASAIALFNIRDLEKPQSNMKILCDITLVNFELNLVENRISRNPIITKHIQHFTICSCSV